MVTVDYRYRTFWPRFFAGIIDAIVFIPLMLLDSWMHSSVDHPAILIPWLVLLSFSFLAYSIGMHARSGQTVGRLISGAPASSTDWSTLTSVELILASANFLWFVLELITTLTNRKRRAIHDFIAGSVVVRV